MMDLSSFGPKLDELTISRSIHASSLLHFAVWRKIRQNPKLRKIDKVFDGALCESGIVTQAESKMAKGKLRCL